MGDTTEKRVWEKLIQDKFNGISTGTRKKAGKKEIGVIILRVICIVFCVAIAYCVCNLFGDGGAELASAYQEVYEAEKDMAYQEAYVHYQSAAEEKYHVRNRVSIYIGNLQEEQKLEVLKVNDVEFIIENKEDNKENIISWLEVPGEGTFVVDLKAGEYIVDEERASVLVRVPYPELTNVKIDYANVQKILFQNDIFNDSIKIGEELAKNQLDKADALIRKEFASNENFYLNAQQAARHTIEGMVKQLNPDVSGLTVDVEFYNSYFAY